MSTPLTFQIAEGMAWSGNKVTDHNRQEISVDYERLEDMRRTVNGTMRKYVVGDKRSVSTSWNDLPSKTSDTVDGFWGGEEMESFYTSNPGAFPLRLSYGDGTNETITVMFTSFDKTITKRAAGRDLWNVSVTMEEV